MPLSIPTDQVSIRGVRLSEIAGVTVKPRQFVYQPTVNQKRVETYDANGFSTPGLLVPIAKDFKLNVGWNLFSPELLALATAEVDQFYTANVSFATTDDATQTFAASDMIIDGQSLNVDPLSDSMNIGFVITDPSTVSFT